VPAVEARQAAIGCREADANQKVGDTAKRAAIASKGGREARRMILKASVLQRDVEAVAREYNASDAAGKAALNPVTPKIAAYIASRASHD
jgi:hypothetical protein